jgi:hypothetical protein
LVIEYTRNVYGLDKDGRFQDFLFLLNIKAIKVNEWNSTESSACWIPCMETCALFLAKGAMFPTLGSYASLGWVPNK